MSSEATQAEAAQAPQYSRRSFLKMVTVAAGAVVSGGLVEGLLGGCSQRPTTPGARVTLTQWYHQYGEKGTEAAVMRYAKQYTKAYPDIAVQVTWVPGDYNTKVNTALLTANGPDLFEKNGLTLPMVNADQVAPLDDLLSPQERADFSKSAIEPFSQGGKLYGLKMVGDTGVIYYRRSLMDKAGLKEPRTLDELIAASKALKSGTRQGLYVGNDGGVGALLNLAPWSAGSDFLVNNEIVFDNARTAQAFEGLAKLSNSGALLIGAPTDWWDPSAFNDGLCAMAWGGLWAYPAIRDKFKDEVGAMPWPALDDKGKPVTFAGGWAQMVNAQSPYLKEAKDYAKWLWIENRKIQEDWNLSYGFHVPPRRSVAQDAKALSDPVPTIAVQAAETYGRYTPPAWSNSMNTALSDAAANIVKQNRDPATELKTAAAKCQRELERQLR